MEKGIITQSAKKVYFGAAGHSNFTIHQGEERKQKIYFNT